MMGNSFHIYLACGIALCSLFWMTPINASVFALLFLFRYVRVFVNVWAYYQYRPALPSEELLSGRSTILPQTTAILSQTFDSKDIPMVYVESLASMLENEPKCIIVNIAPSTDNNESERAEDSRRRDKEASLRKKVQEFIRQRKEKEFGRPLRPEEDDEIGKKIKAKVLIHWHEETTGNRRKQLIDSLMWRRDTETASTDGAAFGVEGRYLQNCLENEEINTIVMADDHCIWPKTFLVNVLAPFERPDPEVGIVPMSKRVRRYRPSDLFTFLSPQWISQDFLNYIACVYLERHNYECAAATAWGGSSFVVSGRCIPMRKSLWEHETDRNNYLDEKWAGSDVPLVPDDDAFIGRLCRNKGMEHFFQKREECTIETELGMPVDGKPGWEKFNGQLYRWARTTFRNGWTTLYEDQRYKDKRDRWAAYAVHLTGFLNFALPLDFLLVFNLWRAGVGFGDWGMMALFSVILFGKLWEPSAHWRREPLDLIYVIPGIFFGWYHSYVKLRALLSVYDFAWSGRQIPGQGESSKAEKGARA
ncbi:hypothetical protein F4780DRAFT_782718 [Xylariomycetidae sp. FL0641]|nr:hypothetical protein F4780DRAFT_782718 [Xylariomycetidae sp. FL0641]